MEKLKMKLTSNTFWVTQYKFLFVPSPKIVKIDQGSPIQKDDSLPTLELVLPFSEVLVTLATHPLTLVTPGLPIKERFKVISFEAISLMKSSKKSEGWP